MFSIAEKPDEGGALFEALVAPLFPLLGRFDFCHAGLMVPVSP